MKTKYKHIRFEKKEQKRKTSIWECLNNSSDDLLGTIKWYGAWHQYCFSPEAHIIFAGDCLEQINQFMQDLRSFELAAKKSKGK